MARNHRLVWVLIISVLLAVSAISVTFCYASAETESFDPVLLENLYYEEILLSSSEYSSANYDYIKGIDISAEGRLIVVLSSGTKHYIDVYDSDLRFKNQLALYTAGTVFVLFDNNHDSLIMYFPKERIKVHTTLDGQYISATNIETVPVEIIEHYARETYEATVHSFHYLMNTNSKGKSVVVESLSGEIMCQYHTTVTNWYNYALLFIVVAVMCVKIAKKIRKTGSNLQEPD